MHRPVKKPRTGRPAKLTNSCVNASELDNGLTEEVIFMRPVNRMPKPIAIVPISFGLPLSQNIIRKMPITAASGASVDG